MDLGIRTKNAIVMGASRGLGKGIAEELAREGVNLFLVARTHAILEEQSDKIAQKYGVKVYFLAIDLCESEAANKIFVSANQHFKDIDILVNISGGPRAAAAMEVESTEYKQEFDKMLAPLIDLTRQVARGMIERKWGRIISVASSGVVQPLQDLVISNLLRSGLVSWSKTLANELAPFNITVNTLLPGRIHTPRIDELDQARANKTGHTFEAVVAHSQASIPMKRYGTVREFASVAAFLASTCASYITGSCIRVDGGMISSIF